MQLTLASKASVILGPDQASGPMMDPRVERATDNCKDTEAYFFFYCITWETFPTPGNLVDESFAAKG